MNSAVDADPGHPTGGSSEITLEDLRQMGSSQLLKVMHRGGALDEEALADTQYLGVDLSLPGFMRSLLWLTFRKTFHRDPDGDVRGWNVKMQQNGIDGIAAPLQDRRGRAKTFGHYRVRPATGIRFPRGWQGEGRHLLDYGAGRNTFFDLARLGYTPLVAVNPGSMELLLGWEVFKVGGVMLPFNLFWALRRQGPLEQVVPPPRQAPLALTG